MAFDKDAFLTALDGMSVMELNDLVKAIEEKFGVSAASMALTRSLSSMTDMLSRAVRKASLSNAIWITSKSVIQ